MNVFVASVILSQVGLEEFLDASPEDRLQMFGPLVGMDRMVSSQVTTMIKPGFLMNYIATI